MDRWLSLIDEPDVQEASNGGCRERVVVVAAHTIGRMICGRARPLFLTRRENGPPMHQRVCHWRVKGIK